jgi:O-antigen/teichoic acid export membrane protein
MDAESTLSTSPLPLSQREHKAAFFRQSGWLMITGLTAGFLTWGVHFLSKKVPDDEWGLFLTLLAVTMCIPGIPLQMVFAQQTAAALATGRDRQMALMIRLAGMGTLALCVVGGLALLLGGEQYLAAKWSMSDPSALWVTLVAVLFTFWMPMFAGVMQGQQNFLWLGWALILNGLGRLCASAAIVIAWHGRSRGLITGVAIGMAVATGVGIWQTRGLWSGRVERFDWRALLRQIIPLMIGFGAFQFLFSADMFFVKAYFPADDVSYYGAAGTLSRALLWFVGPLTAVMFPKIVHSVARAEKTDLVGLTLLCTAVLAGLGAVGLCIVGPYAVRFVYKPEYVALATQVLPWYAGAMLPYCLANVLVNNLLARLDFRIVPVLAVLAVGYAVTLTYIHGSLIAVLQTLGVFNLMLLVIATWLTRRARIPAVAAVR